MSLYNMLFGQNYFSHFYLAMLGLTPGDVGRFRDCFLQKTDEGDIRIVVYTRNGGGNREDYEGTTATLQDHPEYVTDFDDEFDCTYASYVFKVPAKWADVVRKMAESPDQQVDPGARFQKLLSDMQAGKDDDPAVAHALEVGKKILEPILKETK